MMRFYVFQHPPQTVTAPKAPAGLTLTFWRPDVGGLWPPDCRGAVWAVWRLFHSLRVFSNGGYAVALVHESGILVHRALITPGYFRFPFMARNDLQIGDTWTAPEHRGRGIATWALTAIVAELANPERHIWYLADEGNQSSCRVAERAGFRLTGLGHRSARLGIAFLGRYRLTRVGATDLRTGARVG
jgi:RimJ/RimL family protein N-acetyltransferase